MNEYTVKLYAPDGALVFAGFLKPDQFSISHYPDRAAELDIHRAVIDPLPGLHDKRIVRLTEENA